VQDRIDISEISLEDIDPVKILEVHSLDGNAQNGFLNGCIDSLIWAFLFKNYGLKDWSIYIERFATPSVIAKYPPLMSKADKDMLMNAVRNFGHLFKAVIPDNAVIEFGSDQTKSQTSDVFERYIDYWNTELSIRVLGQTGTTNKLDKGSYGAIEALEAVRNDVVRADLIMVEAAMNEIISRLCALNGFDKPPKFKFAE
jgi:phage gp29-like protein